MCCEQGAYCPLSFDCLSKAKPCCSATSVVLPAGEELTVVCIKVRRCLEAQGCFSAQDVEKKTSPKPPKGFLWKHGTKQMC